MQVTLYHNPRCSKSRQALALLEARGCDIELIKYLEQPPDAQALERLCSLLDIQPLDLMRRGEDDYRTARDALAGMTPAEQLRWLAAHPRVIQRPVAVAGGRACIGRPPENVLGLLG